MAIEIHVLKFEDGHREVLSIAGPKVLSMSYATDEIEAECIADLERARWQQFGVSGILHSDYPLPFRWSYFFEVLDTQILARSRAGVVTGFGVSVEYADTLVRQFSEAVETEVEDYDFDDAAKTHYYFMADGSTVAVFPDAEIVQWADRV